MRDREEIEEHGDLSVSPIPYNQSSFEVRTAAICHGIGHPLSVFSSQITAPYDPLKWAGSL